MVKVRKDLIGMTFGRLTVVQRAPDYIDKSGRASPQWYCNCSCGNKNKIVRQSYLKNGDTKSCGCLNLEQASRVHKKYNKYDLSGEYGIGWTSNTNKEFYFDIDDYDLIKDHCWNESIHNNYHCLMTKIDNKNIRMTKLLGCIYYDHINRNPLDNRRCNLRPASQAENTRNKSKSTRNSSGIIGVCWSKKYNSWESEISVNRNHIHLGRFNNQNNAIIARLQAELKYFGEFSPAKRFI